MKRLIFLLVLATVLSTNMAYAQSIPASPSGTTVTPAVSPENKEKQNLVDKLAAKLIEERKKNNKAISGFVIDRNESAFKIRNELDEDYEVKLDDVITKYYQVVGAQRKEIKPADIAKGMFVIVSGVLNEKTIQANYIYIDEMFLVKSGKVTEINKTNFILKVTSTEKDAYSLEVESSTKQQMVNSKTLEIERIGFSKIKEGDTIHFVVKKTGNEKENIYSALKILIIPQEYFMK